MSGRWLRVFLAGPARFLREEEGVFTILSLLFFVMLMAIGGLSIDIGRVYGERGQMQAYVDHASLSAASQLDRQTGALNRAVRAAMGDANGGPLVTGTQSFATGPSALNIQQMTFLDVLGPYPGPLAATPAAGDDVLCTYAGGAFTCNGGLTIDQAGNEAQFVEVRAVPRDVSYFLLPIVDFIGRLFNAAPAVTQMTIGLRATAGFKSEVCDLTPIMICNPDEPPGNLNTLYPYSPNIGEQILMKSSQTNAAWVPGDFGLLQPNADAGGICNGNPHGAGFITCILALIDPLTQCTAGSIQVKPGQAEVTSNGFNVRFDMYPPGNGPNSFKGDPAHFAPSINVTKGIVGKTPGAACPNPNSGSDFIPAPNMVPFPRDSNLQLDPNARFGNTIWNAQTYWAKNHNPLTDPYPLLALGATPTRFAVYNCENGYGTGACSTRHIPNKRPPSTNENGNPTCVAPGVGNPAGGPPPARDRRTLTMAVVDCHAAGLNGNNSNIGPNIPVVAYVQMFLTEPVGLNEDATGKITSYSSNSNKVYGEVVGVVKPGDDSGVLHVNPVLYR